MKVAVITPVPELSVEYSKDFCLLLNHLMRFPYYATFYKNRRKEGAYLVLDNSAHEQKTGTNADALLTSLAILKAQEVVVPDMLFSGEGTLKTSREALTVFLQDERFAKHHPRLMLVPQGKDYAEWRTCLQGLVWLYAHLQGDNPDLLPDPPVIGMSKDYEMWDGGLHLLLKNHLYPLINYGMDIHLLGWGRNARAYQRLAKEFPLVRSTDSAKPYVYATEGVWLPTPSSKEPWPVYPTRPPKFFDTVLTPGQRTAAQHNVAIFKEMVSGR